MKPAAAVTSAWYVNCEMTWHLVHVLGIQNEYLSLGSEPPSPFKHFQQVLHEIVDSFGAWGQN